MIVLYFFGNFLISQSIYNLVESAIVYTVWLE